MYDISTLTSSPPATKQAAQTSLSIRRGLWRRRTDDFLRLCLCQHLLFRRRLRNTYFRLRMCLRRWCIRLLACPLLQPFHIKLDVVQSNIKEKRFLVFLLRFDRPSVVCEPRVFKSQTISVYFLLELVNVLNSDRVEWSCVCSNRIGVSEDGK